jgi:hypothetical protein
MCRNWLVVLVGCHHHMTLCKMDRLTGGGAVSLGVGKMSVCLRRGRYNESRWIEILLFMTKGHSVRSLEGGRICILTDLENLKTYRG